MKSNYEDYESAFSGINNAIKRLVEQKMKNLSNRKWIFKGWILYPDYTDIKFELKYHDDLTEENYSIEGYCNISEKFTIKQATIDFEVRNEKGQKFLSFKTDYDDENELEGIEDTINLLLRDNRSYRYFCEDYERYMRKNPIDYLKGLINDQLINFEEKIYDDGNGCTYQYIGEFGEDSIEIVVDDSEPMDGEECIEIFDFIEINVSDRFHFEYRDSYSDEIRSLLPMLKKTIITVNDFLIRTSTKYCINREHHLKRIKALICVDNGKIIKEVSIEAMFCVECNQYFISELEYQKLKSQGYICCRIITIEEYIKIRESGFDSWAEKSLPRSYGYTVNAQDNLTDYERHRILSFIIENDIMKADEVIGFIEWLVRKNGSDKYYFARQKWNRDIAYVRNYKPVEGVVRVRDIYKKQYRTCTSSRAI